MVRNTRWKIFLIAALCVDFSISAENRESLYLLKDAEIEDVHESSLYLYVGNIFKKEVDLKNFVFIEGTSDSSVAQKYSVISLENDSVYITAEPELVDIETWDPIIDCLQKHVKFVDEGVRKAACSRTLALNANLKKLLLNLRENEYMSFNSDYRIEFVKNGSVFKIGISKYNDSGNFFEYYNRLYEEIKTLIDVPMESCQWKQLIRNVKDFTRNTENPKSMADIGFACPEL